MRGKILFDKENWKTFPEKTLKLLFFFFWHDSYPKNCPWKTAVSLDDNNKVMCADKERQRSESLKVSSGCAGSSQSAEDSADIRRLCSA